MGKRYKLVFFVDRNNLTTLIVSALGADTMGQTRFAAVGAVHAGAGF